MPLNDPPSSDVPLLTFLSIAVAAMIGFGFFVTWLARPTVVPNQPYTYSEAQKRAPIIARIGRSADSIDPEHAAVAFALAENERLGLGSPNLASAPSAPPPELKPVKPAKTVSAKTKRVARSQREGRPPRDLWAYNPHGMFGGFFR